MLPTHRSAFPPQGTAKRVSCASARGRPGPVQACGCLADNSETLDHGGHPGSKNPITSPNRGASAFMPEPAQSLPFQEFFAEPGSRLKERSTRTRVILMRLGVRILSGGAFFPVQQQRSAYVFGPVDVFADPRLEPDRFRRRASRGA